MINKSLLDEFEIDLDRMLEIFMEKMGEPNSKK